MKTEEIHRLRELTRACFSVLGLSFREAEVRLGLGLGQFSRAFSGTRNFRLEHIYQLCQATGLHPAEFFRRAYPVLPGEPSETERKLARVFGLLGGGGAEPVERGPFLTLRASRGRFRALSEPARQELLHLLVEEAFHEEVRANGS
jgi:hypothetical protein